MLYDYYGNPFHPYVDTPQSVGAWLVVGGNFLTAAGASSPPYVSVNGVGTSGGSISVSGFHVGSGWHFSDTQINMPIWVDANATTGTYSVVVTTAGGSSSPMNFTVGDATPVITNVSPSSFTVGAPSQATVSGQHLGTVCPTLAFPFTVQSVSVSGCGDGQVTVNFIPTSAGSGPLKLTDNGYGSGFQNGGNGSTPQTTSPIITATMPTVTLSSSNPLWFFGIGNSPPASFMQGNVQTTISAGGATGGSFAWTIPVGNARASFSNGTATSATTTSTNSVVLYSLSFGVTSGDVAVSLSWTDSAGVVHPPVAIAISIDSPFRAQLATSSPVTSAYICTLPPVPATGHSTNGWFQTYTYKEISKFGTTIVGQSFNENFTSMNDAQPNTWPLFAPNGAVGAPGANAFTDTYCVAGSPGVYTPQPLGAGISGSLVDSAFQYYSVGSAGVGGGVEIQSQTLQRFLDHPALQNVVSPTRTQ